MLNSRCASSTFFYFLFFFFNDPATTEIYTLSLHDALPIWLSRNQPRPRRPGGRLLPPARARAPRAHGQPSRRPRSATDRKSTRLNSSHLGISYAVFCLKKKKKKTTTINYSHTSRRKT